MIFDDLLSELNSPEFQTLRPMQRSILEQYTSLLSSNDAVMKSDVAIEMPAGTGKTLVALLIAEYHRRLNRRIAILTGTRQLAKQVAEDANYLGINVAVFEGPGQDWSPKELRRYQRAETIGIMNYWANFNVNPRSAPAEVLILDDAHLAESAISGLFSIRVKRNENNNLYMGIINAIKSLHPGRYTAIKDILMDMPVESPFLLPFSDWHELSDQIIQLLDEASQAGDNQVRYVWPRIRSNSDALALFITSYEFQLRPVIYPTKTFRHFSDPIQRLYLSATFGEVECR
jgi:Rad3-related DNA helicase